MVLNTGPPSRPGCCKSLIHGAALYIGWVVFKGSPVYKLIYNDLFMITKLNPWTRQCLLIALIVSVLILSILVSDAPNIYALIVW